MRILIYGDQFDEFLSIKAFLSAKSYELIVHTDESPVIDIENLITDLILIDFPNLGPVAKQKVRWLRSLGGVPIIGLINLDSMHRTSELAELELNQVIFKPCTIAELESRIKLVMRHVGHQDESQSDIVPVVERRNVTRRRSERKGDVLSFSENDSTHEVVIEGRTIRLTPKEFELFGLLASGVGQVFSSREILAHLWSDQSHATESDVHQYIRLLRKKIEKDPARPRLIKTAKGFGYQLGGPNGSEPAKKTELPR